MYPLAAVPISSVTDGTRGVSNTFRDHIDVHDLPEEEARLIAMFVEFLRRRKQATAQREVRETEAPSALVQFAVWPLGVKGTLNREDIYDYL